MTIDEIDALKILAKHVRELLVKDAQGDETRLPADFAAAFNTIAGMKPTPSVPSVDELETELTRRMDQRAARNRPIGQR